MLVNFILQFQLVHVPFSRVFLKFVICFELLTAIVGDITPSDGIPKQEKSRREQEALKEMCEVLGGGIRGTPFFFVK